MNWFESRSAVVLTWLGMWGLFAWGAMWVFFEDHLLAHVFGMLAAMVGVWSIRLLGRRAVRYDVMSERSRHAPPLLDDLTERERLWVVLGRRRQQQRARQWVIGHAPLSDDAES